MKFLLLLVAALATFVATTEASKNGINGGMCIACTFIVHVSEQISRKRKLSIADSLNFWCGALGGDQQWLVDVCKGAFGGFADKIQTDFDANRTPDYTCQNTLQLCDAEGPKCHLVPPTEADIIASKTIQTPLPETMAHALFREQFSTTDEAASILDFIFSAITGWSTVGGIKRLEDYSSILQHRPLGTSPVGPLIGDDDKDGSSTFQQLRGFDWRGKDCNDQDATIYPSRKESSHPADVDHDCNGIFGTDSQTGKSYDELYCQGTKRFEFVQIGDSATAGFTLPPCWLSADCISPGAYQALLPVVMNEADFPSCSAVAGWNATACPSLYTSITPFTSVYSFAREQNPCVHRAYHNVGINGASSESMGSRGSNSQIYSFKRDQTKDHPAAVFMALIGNDVCGKSAEESSFTSPDDFEQGWMNSLNYLDTQLPPGSWVFAGGLVDGRLLYDIMSQLYHPLGGGIKYVDFYNYLNCFNTSPCSGWLNEDAAIRDRTTAWANKLNDRLKNIVATKKFKNFKLQYNDYQVQVQKIIQWAQSKGFPLKNFIAEVDSFHPSSTLYSKLADSFINNIIFSEAAEIFSANPHRDEIFAKFGKDLNGY